MMDYFHSESLSVDTLACKPLSSNGLQNAPSHLRKLLPVRMIGNIAILLNISLSIICKAFLKFEKTQGWSGGVMVLGKLPVQGRPTNLDKSRARAFCACSRRGWGLFGHFFSRLSFLSSFSLSLGDSPI